ncbi:MAG: hypothetical protein ACK4ND_08010 [Cytophagaceae bacterium]
MRLNVVYFLCFIILFSCAGKNDPEPLDSQQVIEDPANDDDDDKEDDKEENQDPADASIVYTIPSGQHSSISTLRFFNKNELKFKAVFNSDAQYTLSEEHQGDINKLYGFSDCGNHHHTNSARFGWRYFDGQLQILAYCYANGIRSSHLLSSLEFGQEYEYSIRIEENKYLFSVNNAEYEMQRGCVGNNFNRYYLFPYFGGTQAAPHDISILITEVD